MLARAIHGSTHGGMLPHLKRNFWVPVQRVLQLTGILRASDALSSPPLMPQRMLQTVLHAWLFISSLVVSPEASVPRAALKRSGQVVADTGSITLLDKGQPASDAVGAEPGDASKHQKSATEAGTAPWHHAPPRNCAGQQRPSAGPSLAASLRRKQARLERAGLPCWL